MLTDEDLADMREAIGELLPAVCDILTVTRTSDGQGGQTDTWGTATACVSCRLDWKRGDEQVFGSNLQPYTGWVLSVPYDTTISETQRIQLAGIVYNVSMVDNNKSWNAVLRVALEEVG